MMAKITKGGNVAGAVRYVMNEKKGAELILSDGLLTTDKNTIIDGFKLQSQLRPDVSVSVGHISLNFSAHDSPITNDFIKQIAVEYMQRMQIHNTVFILVRHYDREHPHCHLIYSRVDNNSKVVSDKKDYRRSSKACREISDKYGLYIGKGKEYVKRERLRGADAVKYNIYDILCEKMPLCKNWHELEAALNKHDISVIFKNRGKTNDIQGVVFELHGYKFNGSKIDRSMSYSKISALLEKNAIAYSRKDTDSANISSTNSQYVSPSVSQAGTVYPNIIKGLTSTLSHFNISGGGSGGGSGEDIPLKKRRKRR